MECVICGELQLRDLMWVRQEIYSSDLVLSLDRVSNVFHTLGMPLMEDMLVRQQSIRTCIYQWFAGVVTFLVISCAAACWGRACTMKLGCFTGRDGVDGTIFFGICCFPMVKWLAIYSGRSGSTGVACLHFSIGDNGVLYPCGCTCCD